MMTPEFVDRNSGTCSSCGRSRAAASKCSVALLLGMLSLALLGSSCKSTSEEPETETPPPSVTVAASANPATAGQGTTLTATVTESNSPSPPSGDVTFFVDGAQVGQPVAVTVTGSTGTASIMTTLSQGSHTIKATFTPLSGGSTATSSTSTIPANANTNSQLAGSGASCVTGQTCSFTATETCTSPTLCSGAPTGVVDVCANLAAGATCSPTSSNKVGSCTLNSGTCTVSTTTLTTGADTLESCYEGSSSAFFNASCSTTVTQQVQENTTTTVNFAQGSSSPAVFWQQVTLDATVAPTVSGGPGATGTVQFLVNGVDLGSPVALTPGITNSTASLTASALAVGSNTITAAYSGDTNNLASNTTTPLSVVVNPAATTTRLFSSLDPSAVGASVTYTATVTANAPSTATGSNTPLTGTVTFLLGSTVLGTGPLSTDSSGNTTATFTTAALPSGTSMVDASFGGNSNFNASASGQVTQIVGSASITIGPQTITSAMPGQIIQLAAFTTEGGNVNWTSNSGTFSAPSTANGAATALTVAGTAGSTVAVTATSATNPSVSNTISFAVSATNQNNAIAQGARIFYGSGFDAMGPTTFLGSFVFDANGVGSAVLDINSKTSSNTGTAPLVIPTFPYTVNPDHTLVFNFGNYSAFCALNQFIPTLGKAGGRLRGDRLDHGTDGFRDRELAAAKQWLPFYNT